MFRQYKPQTPAAISKVWNDGLVVFDANILLHLYRVDQRLRDTLWGILEDPNIAPRLWIPHQVAEEVFKNRPGVIAKQMRALDRLINRTRETLLELTELKALKDTPRFHIDRAGWIGLIKTAEEQFVKFLDQAKAAYPASLSDDPILTRLETAIDGKVGPAPDITSRETLIKEGKRRVVQKVPPGYLDESKPENGDYLVWEQCLERCEQDGRSLLLVTDENKADWWQEEESLRVGPRPELRAEFYSRVKGAEFVLVRFDTFVERISQYLVKNVGAEAVEDVREFERVLQTQEFEEMADRADVEREALIQHYRRTAATSKREARRSVDNLIAWFLERYQEPVNGVYYDSREGGYQYVAGGPYCAEEELREEFDDGSARIDRMIRAAARRIDDQSVEWVKKGEY